MKLQKCIWVNVEARAASTEQDAHTTVPVSCRDSIAAQLQLAVAKADSEQLARSIAEEQLSDVEKEKTMLELELKEAMSRLKSDITKKDMTISSVSDSF